MYNGLPCALQRALVRRALAPVPTTLPGHGQVVLSARAHQRKLQGVRVLLGEQPTETKQSPGTLRNPQSCIFTAPNK